MQRIRTDRPRWSYDLKCKQWHRQHWNIAEHNAPFAACSLSHFLLCSCFFFLILPAFLSIFTKLFAFFFCSLYFICRRTQKKLTEWRKWMIEELKAKPGISIEWKQRQFLLQGSRKKNNHEKYMYAYIYKQPYLGCQVNNARRRYEYDTVSNQCKRFPLVRQKPFF